MPDDGLTNDTVASTYTYLLYVSSETTGGGIDSNLKVVKGGDGTQTPLWIGDTTVPYIGLTTSLSSQNDLSANGGNSIDWNAAYGWGDHSTQGYLTSFTETDPIFTASEAYNITSSDISNWNAAFSWNDHATYNYLSNSSSISDLSDVNSGFINGYILKFNGSVWEAVEHSVETTVNSNSSNWDSTYTTVSSNSANWNSTYSTLTSVSANWDSTYTTVSSNSGNWDSTYTTVSSNSGNWAIAYSRSTNLADTSATWDSTYTTVSSNSANWDSAYTSLTSTSSNWDSTYTNVYNNSSNWSNAYTALTSTSSNWDSTYTTVSSNSSYWDSVYTTVSANSANWGSDIATTVQSNSANWSNAYTALTSTSSNWDSAYTTVSGNSGKWETAYGWDDHSTQGYLTSFTEEDPIFTASEAYNITSSHTTNWDTAYSWGDHDGLYLTDLSSEYLSSLSDVNASPSNNYEVLRWDYSNSEWVSDLLPLYRLDDVDSMNAENPDDGQVLAWDSMSSYWTPSSVSIPTQLSDLSDVDSAMMPNGYDSLVYNSSTSEWTASAIGSTGGSSDTTTKTTVSANSGNWSSVYTTVSSNSANWSNAYTALTSTSSNWDSTYTTVSSNSANWSNAYTALTSTSSNWDSVYTTVSANSGSWGTGGSSLTIQNQGSDLSTTATTLNFVGAGVVATGDYGTKTITINGGSSTTLDDITDVSTSGVTNGQVLKYNGSSWEPADDNTGSGGSGGSGSGYWSQDSSTENIYYSAAKVGISDDEYIDENMFGTLSVRASGFGDTSRATYSSTTPISSYALTINGVTSNTDDYIEQGIAFRVGTQQYAAGGTTTRVVQEATQGTTVTTTTLNDNQKLSAHFEASDSYIRSSVTKADMYGAGKNTIFNNSGTTTLVVGAPTYTHTGQTDKLGLAFVYTYNTTDSRWEFSNSLYGDNITGGEEVNFAGSQNTDKVVIGPGNIADEIPGGLAAEGNTIVIGVPDDKDSGTNYASVGKAYIFEYGSGTWSQSQELLGDYVVKNMRFGTSAGIYGDHIAIGSLGYSNKDFDDSDPQNAGVVYFFKKSGTWSSTADQSFDVSDFGHLDPEGSATNTERFGASIAIGELDGTPIAFVGGPRSNPGDTGNVVVFTYTSSSWSVSGMLRPDDTEADSISNYSAFGASIDYDSDNKRLAIGAPWTENVSDATGDILQGNVSVYDVDSAGCTLTNVLLGENESGYTTTRKDGSAFGNSVSLSGSYLLVGSPGFSHGDFTNRKRAGGAYIYTLSSVDVSTTLPQEGYYADANYRWNRTYTLSGYMPGHEDDEGTDGVGGSAIASEDRYGHAVHIYNNHIIVSAPGDEVNSVSKAGSVYHYTIDTTSTTTGGTPEVTETVTTGGDSLSGFHTPGAAITHEKFDRHSQGYLHIKTRREDTSTANLSSTITLDASGNVGFNCYPDASDSNNPWVEIDGALVLDELSNDPPTPTSGKVIIWYDGTNVKWKNDSSSGNLS